MDQPRATWNRMQPLTFRAQYIFWMCRSMQLLQQRPSDHLAQHRQHSSSYSTRRNYSCLLYHSCASFSSRPCWALSTATGAPTAARGQFSIARAISSPDDAIAAQKLATAHKTAAVTQASSRQGAHPGQQLGPAGLLSGPCLVAAGALACSFISLQVKLFDQHVPPLQVTACSSAVAWLATSCILAWQGKTQPASAPSPAAAAAAVPYSTPSMQSLLLLRGLLGAATVTAYYAAVEELPLPVAVALFFFHPVLALLLDSAVNDTHVPSRAASSCALTVLGVLVIGWHDQLMLHLEQAAVFFETLGTEGFAGAATAAAAAGQEVIMGPELSLYGVLMGLVAASANAAAFVVVGRIGREVPTLDVCWWQYCVTTHAAVAVLLLSQLESAVVHASATSQPFNSVALSGMQELLLQVQQSLPSQHDTLLLSGVVVANFLGQLLLNAGFQQIDAGRGAAINTLQVLFANLWDVVLLHSAPSAAMLAGSGMIAAGVVGTRQSTAGEPTALEEQQPLALQAEAQAQQQQQQQQPLALQTEAQAAQQQQWQELLDAQQQQQQLQLTHEQQKQQTGWPAATAAANGSNGASQQQPLVQQEAGSHVQQPSLVQPRRKL